MMACIAQGAPERGAKPLLRRCQAKILDGYHHSRTKLGTARARRRSKPVTSVKRDRK